MPTRPVTKPARVDLSRFTSPNLPQYGPFIPAHNGAAQVLDASYECRLNSNGTGPRIRQLQDEVGGVAPAALSPDQAARCRSSKWVSTAIVGFREYAMRNVTDRLMRLWQGSQRASNTQVVAMIENRDRSSMADFVRILQVYDQDQYGRS
jgi:hypothetical protein